MCTADICPVGALETKDFHHKIRVWFLEDVGTSARRMLERLQYHGLDLQEPSLAADAAPQ